MPYPYSIYDGYTHGTVPVHFDDTTSTDGWQREVYLYAKSVAERYEHKKIVDFGCGSGYKLVVNFQDHDTLGIDLPPTIEFLNKTYPDRQWTSSMDRIEGVDLFIASDVIEHMVNPDELIEYIKLCAPKDIILSTPDRNLIVSEWGGHHLGPPGNNTHLREWAFEEFQQYISQHFEIIDHVITNVSQATQLIHCKIKQ
jgi:hypothetical protein